MARLASQSKAGYYPTPVKEMEFILQNLTFKYSENNKSINIIDPCCGTGEALKMIKDNLKEQIVSNEIEADVFSYGVELEKTRSEQAALTLDYVVNEGYESVRTENKYGAMWLNPPYDETFNERTELRFLRQLTSKSKGMLQQGGLLMFCIPQHVLKNVATTISKRFTEVKVYRFTDENYPVFNQIVLFGYLNKSTYKIERATAEMLKTLAEIDPSEIPTLEDIEEAFIIPANAQEIKVFRAGRLNIEEIKKDLIDSPVFDEFNKRITPKNEKTTMKSPLLPLKSTHAGVAVASGAIGGNLGNHIVSGVTKQRTATENVHDKEGHQTHEKVTKYYASVVRVFTQDGIHELK